MQEPEAKVRDWLLAILRYAVTLEQSDRAAAATIARNLDGAESKHERTGFRFFTKTNSEFCDAIANTDDPHRLDTLHRHLRMIDDDRLRRGLAAAIEIEWAVTASSQAKSRYRGDLWKGLRQK